MIFVTTRQSTVMVNSGETAHLSCSVQAIFFTITILKIIMTNWPPLSSSSRWSWSWLPCLAGQCGEAQRDLEERGWRRSPAGRKVTFFKLADPWSLVLMTLMYSLYLIVGFYSILIPNSDGGSLSPLIQTLVQKPPNWSGSSSKALTSWSAKLVGLIWEGEAWNEKKCNKFQPASLPRFTCTAQNGFGVDMVSSFLYPLAPAFYDYSQ